MSRITAYLKGRNGETRYASIPPDVAPVLYETGATVEVPDVSEFFEPVGRLQRELAAELGELPGHVVAILTPPGVEALPMHFDAHDVFVVQIAGSKRWTVAPSEAPKFPMHAFSPTMRGAQRDGDTWQSYFPAQFPQAMPSDAATFSLCAGSVAYVPAGHWHATASVEGSVSLTIALAPTRFIETFLKALSGKLIADPEMRRPLSGLFGPERARHTTQVNALLDRALGIAQSLSAEALIPSRPARG